jgi:hypothetical protein
MTHAIDHGAPGRRAASRVRLQSAVRRWGARLAAIWREAMEAYALMSQYRGWPGNFL